MSEERECALPNGIQVASGETPREREMSANVCEQHPPVIALKVDSSDGQTGKKVPSDDGQLKWYYIADEVY